MADSPPDCRSCKTIFNAFTGKAMDVNSWGAACKESVRYWLREIPLHTRLCARTSHDDCQIGHEHGLKYYIENNLPSFVSALIMISPFTLRFLRLCLSDRNNWVNASVLMREGQKPWKVSAFSHQVCIRISRPDRPPISIVSMSDNTVSRWLFIKNANGMTRL